MEAHWIILRNERFSTAGKMMTSIFWDSRGVIIVDYLEEGRTKMVQTMH